MSSGTRPSRPCQAPNLIFCPVALLLITGDNLEICLLPLEKGPCRALISRFYYDRNQQKCRKFKYGGCLGNANNFHTKELCEHTCGSIESKCSGCTGLSQRLPQGEGQSSAHFPSPVESINFSNVSKVLNKLHWLLPHPTPVCY